MDEKENINVTEEEDINKYIIKWNEPVDQNNFLNRLLEENVEMQQYLNISDEVLAKYYVMAAEILQEHNFENSRDAFLFLTFLNPNYANFWIGLGMSEQALGCFDEAISAYRLAEVLDPQNPTIHINAFKCHKALDNQQLADESYEKCTQACSDQSKHAQIKSELESLNNLTKINK